MAQLRHTEVILTPQSSYVEGGVGAAGVSMNSNDSSDVVDLGVDMMKTE